MSKKLIIYSDGGARGNPGPSAIGVLVCAETGEKIQDFHETIGDTTNNVAEYSGVIKGLELARGLEAEEVDFFVDSQLVARQLSGVYKIKAPHIKELVIKVKLQEKNFKKVVYRQVPRTHEKIQYVDKLVNKALDAAGY